MTYREVRQGAQLLIIAINIKPLAASIRQNEEIKNIKVIKEIKVMGNKEHIDEILTYISDPIFSVPALTDTLNMENSLVI